MLKHTVRNLQALNRMSTTNNHGSLKTPEGDDDLSYGAGSQLDNESVNDEDSFDITF